MPWKPRIMTLTWIRPSALGRHWTKDCPGQRCDGSSRFYGIKTALPQGRLWLPPLGKWLDYLITGPFGVYATSASRENGLTVSAFLQSSMPPATTAPTLCQAKSFSLERPTVIRYSRFPGSWSDRTPHKPSENNIRIISWHPAESMISVSHMPVV